MERLRKFKNPTRWTQLSTKTDPSIFRELGCPFEEECLDIAAEGCWEGFVCLYCIVRPIWVKEKKRRSHGKDLKDNSLS